MQILIKSPSFAVKFFNADIAREALITGLAVIDVLTADQLAKGCNAESLLLVKQAQQEREKYLDLINYVSLMQEISIDDATILHQMFDALDGVLDSLTGSVQIEPSRVVRTSQVADFCVHAKVEVAAYIHSLNIRDVVLQRIDEHLAPTTLGFFNLGVKHLRIEVVLDENDSGEFSVVASATPEFCRNCKDDFETVPRLQDLPAVDSYDEFQLWQFSDFLRTVLCVKSSAPTPQSTVEQYSIVGIGLLLGAIVSEAIFGEEHDEDLLILEIPEGGTSRGRKGVGKILGEIDETVEAFFGGSSFPNGSFATTGN